MPGRRANHIARCPRRSKLSDLRFWPWTDGVASFTVGDMSITEHLTVVGLVPRAVRLELLATQVEDMVNEILTRLESQAGSWRESHERRGRLADADLASASDALAEYRCLLDALRDGDGLAATAVTASTPIADELVRGCAHQAVHRLAERLDERSGGGDELRHAASTAAAWAQTLADLRDLDEGGPDLGGG